MFSLSEVIAKKMIDCFENGGKVLICGNGGSSAEAQHFAAELVGHFEKPRKALPAIALTTDTSIITAISNDDGYEFVFSRQIEALGKKGDLLILLSTSGRSMNILTAQLKAQSMGIEDILFPIKSEGQSTADCQEKHLVLIHQICREIDNFYAS